MADMHVLVRNGNMTTVAMHFPVPAGNNSVDVAWTDALVNTGRATTQLTDGRGPGEILTAEKTAIEAGTIFEHVGTYLIESGGTSDAELRASLREFYGDEETRLTDNLKAALRYYGHTEAKA